MIFTIRNVVFFVAIAALSACGRGGESESTFAKTPDAAVMAMVSALEANDLKAFLSHSLSKEDYSDARREWDAARSGAIDLHDREQIDAALAALADDALADELMAEIGPALEAARPNLPIVLMAAQTMGHASIAANEKLTEAQKNSANELLAAFGKWAGGKDLANPELARTALTGWVADARRIDLKTADDLQALEFEEMIARASILMSATRDMLRVYGLMLDDVFTSTSAEVLRQQGDTALVRVNFVLLDTEQQFDVVLIRKDDRWLPENLLSEQIRSVAGPEQPSAEI